MAFEATVDDQGMPRPRELLVEFGRGRTEVDAMEDDEMWRTFQKEFGGIKWTTMRELNKLDPAADAKWFHNKKISFSRGEAMLKHALAHATDTDDVSVKTPQPKKTKPAP